MGRRIDAETWDKVTARVIDMLSYCSHNNVPWEWTEGRLFAAAEDAVPWLLVSDIKRAVNFALKSYGSPLYPSRVE